MNLSPGTPTPGPFWHPSAHDQKPRPQGPGDTPASVCRGGRRRRCGALGRLTPRWAAAPPNQTDAAGVRCDPTGAWLRKIPTRTGASGGDGSVWPLSQSLTVGVGAEKSDPCHPRVRVARGRAGSGGGRAATQRRRAPNRGSGPRARWFLLRRPRRPSRRRSRRHPAFTVSRSLAAATTSVPALLPRRVSRPSPAADRQGSRRTGPGLDPTFGVLRSEDRPSPTRSSTGPKVLLG